MTGRFLRRLLDWIHWQCIKRCQHPSGNVTYDLLEGGGNVCDVRVSWCQICGAVKAHPNQEFRTPRPDWRE